MDKIILISLLKKYGQLIIIVILLFCVFNCTREAETNYITKTITLHKESIKMHYDTIKIIKKKIVYIKEKVKDKLEEVKEYNNDDVTNYYRDRYNCINEIQSVGIGISLTDSIAKINISELVQYDGVVQELRLTNDILDNTNFIVDQQNDIIDIVEKELKKEKRRKNRLKFFAVLGFIGGVFIGNNLH